MEPTIHDAGYTKVVDVTDRPIGSSFGYKVVSEPCKVCGAAAICAKKGYRKGAPFANFAHTIRVYLDQNSKEPKAEYTDVHEYAEPRGH